MNTYDLSLMQNSKYIDNLYTYKSEEEFDIGDIVLVDFGMGKKIVEGIVVRKNHSPLNPKTKEIISGLENTYSLNKIQVDTAIFIRQNYMSTYYESFKLFTSPSNYTKLSENFDLIIKVKNEEKLEDIIQSTRKNAKTKLSFLKALQTYPIIEKSILSQMLDVKVDKYINELEEEDVITVKKVRIYAKNNFVKEEIEEIALNEEQSYVYNKILEQREKKPILLHGVTGSGKTKVYINLVKEILKKGKNAVILVPEISLTMQTIKRFVDEFDEDIAVIHSNLTKREKFEQWLKIKSKVSKIVIGARSALFSPLEDIGIIIIDECHDDAYRSEMSPKYDTIEVADFIAQKYDAHLILASATPSISQFYRAKEGSYYIFSLKKRANEKPLPRVEIVNMLEDMKSGNKLELSTKLQLEMKRELAKGNQVILFLNKRGYSNQLTCDNCGYVPKCENCDISLTYHKTTNSYKCHYCNFETIAFRTCPKCHDGNFIYMGSGTQKIETQVKNLFPSAEVFRMDRDTTMQKGENEKILTKFRNTPRSVLIGTQMIGKGHDFPNVSLVGIINADQGIYAPDYKALERSYNILEQVGGRAGRGDEEGSVIIQTFSNTNSLLYYLKTHSYEDFYEDEIEKRKIFKYEPFGNIIRLIISSADDEQAQKTSYKIRDAIKFYNETRLNSALKIYEPSTCSITRIDNKFRYQIVIRVDNENLFKCKTMINYVLTQKRKVVLTNDSISVSVDVNPDNML